MKKQRIVVAMSGGVDSSVVAVLAKEAGHEVIGVTLQLYDHGTASGRKGSCCAGQDIHDARRVAAHLGIPHYVLDYEAAFANAVMRPFAESYAAGRTPVPCVACNQDIKFKDLLAMARELGADGLATGHYVRRRDGAGGPVLLRGADPERDQSYFLFATTREQLAFLRFPVGGLRKAEVRAIARTHGLPIADKDDSQDICFVPAGHYSAVVERLKPGAAEPGDIVHVDGRRLGRHNGTIHFTIGQRRGLGIACGEPLYVVRIDAGARRVIVGPRSCLATAGVTLDRVNWLGEEPWPLPAGAQIEVWARVRSSQPPKPATLSATEAGARAEVRLREPEQGVAPGQACVFYDSDGTEARVLGGGWIAQTASGGGDRASSHCAGPAPRL